MFMIQVSPSAAICHIDDFPTDTERSVKGSLHLYPGAVKELTAGEWEHIKKAHGYIATHCSVVVGPKSPAPTPAVASTEPAAAATEEKPAPRRNR